MEMTSRCLLSLHRCNTQTPGAAVRASTAAAIVVRRFRAPYAARPVTFIFDFLS